MKNWHRWALSLGLGFGIGAGTAAMNPQAKLGDVLRQGIGGIIPAATALKMTLAPAKEDESKAKGAAA